MEESSSNKPLVVTSSLNFKVTTPSFYNQPKKFASVAPPRPKSQTPPSAPSPTPLGTAVIGRVGDLPPPPSSLCDGINTVLNWCNKPFLVSLAIKMAPYFFPTCFFFLETVKKIKLNISEKNKTKRNFSVAVLRIFFILNVVFCNHIEMHE